MIRLQVMLVETVAGTTLSAQVWEYDDAGEQLTSAFNAHLPPIAVEAHWTRVVDYGLSRVVRGLHHARYADSFVSPDETHTEGM